jgi:hypothetical protein
MRKLLTCTAALFACAQLGASAHALVVPIHFAHGFKATNNALANVPVSGSSRAFQATIKSLTGLSIKNTILNAPLNGISGQFSGVAYLGYTNATVTYTNDFNFPATAFFGPGPLNRGYAVGDQFVSSVGNSITGGIPTAGKVSIDLFPHSIAGHTISGAQRILQGYYNQAATNGYNGGLYLLQHPTGGLLFGTTYYSGTSYPGLFAFGNNYFASASAAKQALSGLTLPASTMSYIQFGKIVRPITNGIFTSTQFFNYPYNPPYSVVPGHLSNDGYFGVAIGSNPFNVPIFSNGLSFPHTGPTFFK